MKKPDSAVILSVAKDLLYLFSIRNSRCFCSLAAIPDLTPGAVAINNSGRERCAFVKTSETADT